MSASILVPDVPASEVPEARPGSRAARLAIPRSIDVLKDLAAEHGVCARPITLRRTDLGTGQTELIDLPCGATRDDRCPACARRAKRLPQVQIREGWHRRDEPHCGPQPATEEQKALIVLRAHYEYRRATAERNAEWDQLTGLDDAIAEVERAIAAEGLRGRVAPPHESDDEDRDDDPGHKRIRSTRRRQDVPDLPRQKVDPRTVGRTYLGRDGQEHQPSMWLTLTLDSYGPVHGVRRTSNGRPIPCPCGSRHNPDDAVCGVPVDPDSYDYRRAAWDAVHFARLLDRYWQNLRRAVGWNVQYAGCVEPQRRLAPHAHFAIRGTIARTMLERVAAATYHQVWWPTTRDMRYAPDRPPVWDTDQKAWVDPVSQEPLTTWQQALDTLDADSDAEPVHVVRFGDRVLAKGVESGSKDVKRTIGYITKYVTKHSAECHAITTDAQRDHIDRLWRELRVTPCSDRCANWLLYGIQPKRAHFKLRPGNCKGRVHQKATLGIGGRRVLVSRDWSGKTLADHRADARAWVRALLGISHGHDQAPTGAVDPGTPSPVAWEYARPGDPDMPPLQHRLLRAISQRIQWRAELDAARERAGTGPPGNVSATAPGDPTRKEA